MTRLLLTVKGKPGTIPLESFITIVESSFGILKDLDIAISKQPRGSMDWIIETVNTEHSIGMELVSVARNPEADYSSQVAETYTDGIEIIQKEGRTPPYFSDNCIRLINKTASMLRNEGASAFEVIDENRNKSAEIQPEIQNTTNQLVGLKYKSFGSVEGTLEMISIHKPARFNIYHSISLHAVKCNLRDEDIESVIRALGLRVIVTGLVSYNAKDEAKSVLVDELEVLPSENELPSIDDFIGSDPFFTEDMTTEEFLRSIRSV